MLISLVQGQIQSESRPAFRAIGGRDAASVNTDNCFNESKSKPVPPGFASFNSSLKEVASNFRIKARTTIFDDECGQATFRTKGKTHKRGSGQVLEFVVQQVGYNTVEESGIGQHFD